MAVPSNSDSSEEVPPIPAPNFVENFRRVMTEMLADMSPSSFNNFRQVLTEMASIFEEHQRRMPPETPSPLRPKKVRNVCNLLLG
jgi:hypothetical protein